MLIYQLTLYSIISLGRTIMEIQSALVILDTNTSKLLLLFKEYSMQTFPVLFLFTVHFSFILSKRCLGEIIETENLTISICYHFFTSLRR